MSDALESKKSSAPKWILGGCRFQRNGEPLLNEKGHPEIHMVILDELNIALRYDYVDLDDVLDVVDVVADVVGGRAHVDDRKGDGELDAQR